MIFLAGISFECLCLRMVTAKLAICWTELSTPSTLLGFSYINISFDMSNDFRCGLSIIAHHMLVLSSLFFVARVLVEI